MLEWYPASALKPVDAFGDSIDIPLDDGLFGLTLDGKKVGFRKGSYEPTVTVEFNDDRLALNDEQVKRLRDTAYGAAPPAPPDDRNITEAEGVA